ncbi:MAG: hypothetical protein M3Z26_14755 [Bacteroidota bacterium]|nr:hypothetical protein [Bacteroidota bacterium]
MEIKAKSKKDLHKFINKELGSILIDVNPKIDKKLLKKSIKKAGRILYRSAKNKKSFYKGLNISDKSNSGA